MQFIIHTYYIRVYLYRHVKTQELKRQRFELHYHNNYYCLVRSCVPIAKFKNYNLEVRIRTKQIALNFAGMSIILNQDDTFNPKFRQKFCFNFSENFRLHVSQCFVDLSHTLKSRHTRISTHELRQEKTNVLSICELTRTFFLLFFN